MHLDRQSVRGFSVAVCLYLLAAGAVILTGAERHPLFVIGAALLLLLAAAIANMTVRRVREANPPQLPGAVRLGVPLFLTAVAVGFAVYFFQRGVTDGYGLFCICGAFMTFGHYVAELRSRERWQIWRGLLMLGLLTVAIVGGVLVGSFRPVGLLISLGALLLAPVGLTLLSTDVIRKNGVRPLRFTAIGLFLLIVGAIWLDASRVDRYFVLLVVGVALLLVLAIAADTQADVILVATLVALVWSGYPRGVPLDEDVVPAPIAASAVRAGEPIVIALGDSYMSGEGAKRFYDGTNQPGEPLKNECRRAPTAYAHEVLEAPESEAFGARLGFFACSGALGRHVWDGGQHSGEPPGGPRTNQLAQLKSLLDAGVDVSLVLVSIGGNDAGFSRIGIACVAPGNCLDRGQIWLTDLQRVAENIDDTYAEIRKVVRRDVPVVAVPYPQPIKSVRTGCDYSLLEDEEHRFLNGFVTQLNRVVAQAADDHGFYFLKKMETALEGPPGLRICDAGNNDDNLGVNFIALSDTDGLIDQLANPQSWLHNSLHPNERGHDEMGRVLAAWMASNPSPRGLSDEPGSETYIAASVEEVMGTDFTDDYCGKPDFEVDRCALSDTEWTITEVSRFLRGILAPLSLIVLGAWLISLAALVSTRPLSSGLLNWLDVKLFGLLGRGRSGEV